MFKSIILSVVFFSMLSVNATEYDLLLDASASMRGFQKADMNETELAQFMEQCQSSSIVGSRVPVQSASLWTQVIGNISQEHAGARCLFGDTFKCYAGSSLAAFCLNDLNTDLAGAMREWKVQHGSSKRVIIITDNVADTENASSMRNQDAFAKAISGKESVFTHKSVIVLKLLFNGNVYSQNDQANRYNGKRALVVYILGGNKITNQEYYDFRDEIEEAVKRNVDAADYDLYQIQPFSTERVQQKYGSIIVSPGDENKVNVKIENIEEKVDKISISNYTLGDPLSFKFDTYLEIQGAFYVDVDLQSEIIFDAFPEQIVSNKSASNSVSDSVMFKATVSPTEITLFPDKSEKFSIGFQMGRLSLADMPFRKKFMYALTNEQELNGILNLNFKINRNNYNVHSDAIANWTHDHRDRLGEPDENIQSRAYRLDKILKSGVAELTTEEKLKSIPIVLNARYEMGPIISAFALLCVILGLLYWLFLKSRKNQDYVIEDEMGGRTPLSIGLGQAYRHYDNQHRNLFNLRYIGIGYLATSRFKLKGPHLLSPGQSFEIYNKANETWQHFYLRQEKTSEYSDDSFDW